MRFPADWRLKRAGCKRRAVSVADFVYGGGETHARALRPRWNARTGRAANLQERSPSRPEPVPAHCFTVLCPASRTSALRIQKRFLSPKRIESLSWVGRKGKNLILFRLRSSTLCRITKRPLELYSGNRYYPLKFRHCMRRLHYPLTPLYTVQTTQHPM